SGADGDDGPPGLELAVVERGLLLGDAQADQCPEDAAGDGPGGGAGRDAGEQAAGHDRADAGDQPTGDGDAEQGARGPAGDGPGGGPGFPLRSLGHGRVAVAGDDADLIVGY